MSLDMERIEHSNKVKKVVEYINDGLSEPDAVMLAGYTELEYEQMREKYPKVAYPIKKAIVEYKHKLLKPLSAAAGDGDKHLGQWLLEKRFGGEFNQKARQIDEATEGQDLLVAAIREVQMDGSSTTLVGIRKQARRALKAVDSPLLKDVDAISIDNL